MTAIDWIIVALYVVTAVAVGLYFTKKAAKTTTDFFLAGRTLSWFIAGTSILATTFSSDTPLVVAGISRRSGISGHWFWLSAAIGQIATVFFFAKLWRRTEVVTDIEFVVKRYRPGCATSILRVFKVLFDGLLINCIVMASVTLAMAKIIKTLLNLPQTPFCRLPILGSIDYTALMLIILGASAVLYCALSGLYGVVYTDLIQFALAMVGSIGLAVFVYIDASKGTGLIAKLNAAPNLKSDFLNFFPNLTSFDLKTFTFFVYISLCWWARAPGHGYYVQRLLATKSEKDAFLAFLWFNFCQYVIRPWPWIFVGLISLYYLPNLHDPESSFPAMINLFLPAGLKGIMVASLLAAFMSTIDTHLNWGASYIVNDLYQPFIRAKKTTKHYVRVSRIAMIGLIVTALIVTTKLTSILNAYKYLTVIFAGVGTVMIARWYWWRVNAWSEITAIAACLLVANYLQIKLPSTPNADMFAVRLVITVVLVTAAWITVTLLTAGNTPDTQTIIFYSKMKIPGPGWKKVANITNIRPHASELSQNLLAWCLCTVAIFSLTLAIGKFVFHRFSQGLIYLTIAAVTTYALKKLVAKVNFF